MYPHVFVFCCKNEKKRGKNPNAGRRLLLLLYLDILELLFISFIFVLLFHLDFLELFCYYIFSRQLLFFINFFLRLQFLPSFLFPFIFCPFFFLLFPPAISFFPLPLQLLQLKSIPKSLNFRKSHTKLKWKSESKHKFKIQMKIANWNKKSLNQIQTK